MSKIKLPNGKTHEVQESEKDYVHVYVTHRNGQQLAEPYVQRYNQQVAKSILDGNTISGKVVHDPKNAFKDADIEAKQVAKSSQADRAKSVKDFSDEELINEVELRGLSAAAAEAVTTARRTTDKIPDMSVSDGDSKDYSDLTVELLKEELSSRELPVSGTKDELIARLTENDSQS